MTDKLLPDWHRAYDGVLLSCQIRSVNADFQVDETLAFELSEDGEHDYLHIQKDGANTNWVAGGLARMAQISESDVGFAGLKDRHAVTTQWFSVRRPAGGGTDWSELDLTGVRVLQQSRHRRKLRRGAHTGNHFRIALRGCSEWGDEIVQRFENIANHGVPNYFGEQRFGHDGGNIDLARELFGGKRLSRNKRSLALSTARSLLFNHILEDRVKDQSWNVLQAGDCANLDGSGSMFLVAEPDDELRQRIDELDIHPSGSLWGSGTLQSGGKVAEREQAIVSRFSEFVDGLENEGIQHARRALRLAVRDFEWERDGDTLWLDFFLTRGAYATAVLREIASY